MKRILIFIIFSTFLIGCKKEFADQNTNPSVVVEPDVSYLFTKALSEFKPMDYRQWFYNNAYYLTWSQATVGDRGSSNSKILNLMGQYELQHGTLIKTKAYVEEINYVIKSYPAEKAAKFENIRVMCNPLIVYLGILGTDTHGSIPYSEAGKILHSNPPILTPKYESQQQLFEIWLKQLDETIEVLGKKLATQQDLGAQDFIYKGDRLKWMKLANSLKLKIAVRLIHTNKAMAIKIAKEVEQSSAGILETTADDFIYNKGSLDYNFNNELWLGVGSRHLISFLVDNKDPRVRFIFQKNDFNSKVIQAFLNENIELPSYIKNVVEFGSENGQPVFKNWKAPGEPWVRYFGAPVNIYAADTAATNDNYFNSDKFKLKNRIYNPLALYNEELTRGGKTYVFPDSPDVNVTKDDQAVPWYAMFYSAAETHLYLAELSLLSLGDANQLMGTPEFYFDKGVRLSVESLNNLAAKNKLPYYDKIYDPNEHVIALQDGEINQLINRPAYKLSGSVADKMEKIYIQQYIHFLQNPNELFVCVRRSAIPKRGSSILSWQTFSENNDVNYPIPRRFEISWPLESDMMYEIKSNAYKSQGFSLSTGNDPVKLNTERVWYDKDAPNFGAGPKL